MFNCSVADVLGPHRSHTMQQDVNEINDVLEQITHLLNTKENEEVIFKAELPCK